MVAELHDLAEVSLEHDDDAFADVVGLHVNPFELIDSGARGILAARRATVRIARLFLIAGAAGRSGMPPRPRSPNCGHDRGYSSRRVWRADRRPGRVRHVDRATACSIAAEEINAAGGVLGRKIRLVVEDDQGRAEEAASVVTKLITSDNVDRR